MNEIVKQREEFRFLTHLLEHLEMTRDKGYNGDVDLAINMTRRRLELVKQTIRKTDKKEEN